MIQIPNADVGLIHIQQIASYRKAIEVLRPLSFCQQPRGWSRSRTSLGLDDFDSECRMSHHPWAVAKRNGPPHQLSWGNASNMCHPNPVLACDHLCLTLNWRNRTVRYQISELERAGVQYCNASVIRPLLPSFRTYPPNRTTRYILR